MLGHLCAFIIFFHPFQMFECQLTIDAEKKLIFYTKLIFWLKNITFIYIGIYTVNFKI